MGAFISLKVAATIAEDIVDPEVITPAIIFAGAGAGAVATAATFIVYRAISKRPHEATERGFRLGQIASASLVALAHGTNDARKTMGVITLALVANGNLDRGAGVPTWVIIAAATAISLGTYIGGWRIIRTLGHRITDIEAPQGFAAETTSSVVILAASNAGFPLSTTHVTSGGVMGAGLGRRAAGVRWGVAGQMVTAWLITLPAAAVLAGLFYLVSEGLGVELLGVAAAAYIFFDAQENHPVTAEDV